MNTEVFLIMLLICSTFTGLVTEAIKNILEEHNKTYYSNTLAGFVSVLVAILINIGYVMLFEITVDNHMLVYCVTLVILSWLCSMIGYDKVLQSITQIKRG